MRLPLLLCALMLVGCGPRTNSSIEDYNTEEIGMPNGKKIRAERVIDPRDMQRGMMFRDSLAPDRGMLFVHQQPAPLTYWMYQVRIPLDIIWMDENRRVVEISANTPPCKESDPKLCPVYGGHAPAAWVLELAGGMAAKYGVRTGSQLSF